MNTKSQAAKSLRFSMSPRPHRPKAQAADRAAHQMKSQIKGSPKAQQQAEDNGKV